MFFVRNNFACDNAKQVFPKDTWVQSQLRNFTKEQRNFAVTDKNKEEESEEKVMVYTKMFPAASRVVPLSA